MRSIKNYIQAVKARREENGDEGFSLIELIVVVVILGILAAIAIPVFANLQDNAEKSAAETTAASAATQFAAAIADDPDGAADAVTDLNSNYSEYTITVAGTTVDSFCVTAVQDEGKYQASSGTADTCTEGAVTKTVTAPPAG